MVMWIEQRSLPPPPPVRIYAAPSLILAQWEFYSDRLVITLRLGFCTDYVKTYLRCGIAVSLHRV